MLKSIIDGGVNSDGYNHIKNIFKEIGLVDMFDYFYENNIGRSNPYHNNTHTFIVVDLVNQYCFREHIGGQLKVCLLVAALYHDFMHSGGKWKDEDNIKVAFNELWQGWLKVNRGYLADTTKTRILPLHMETIRQLIYHTKYPYEPSVNDFFRIVREADILSYEHEQWREYVFQGLCKELGKDYESDKKELLNNLLNFHKKLVEEEIQLPFLKILKKLILMISYLILKKK